MAKTKTTRSPAQRAATKRMIAANKRRLATRKPAKRPKVKATRRPAKRAARLVNPSGMWLSTAQLDIASIMVYGELKSAGKANVKLIRGALVKWASELGIF